MCRKSLGENSCVVLLGWSDEGYAGPSFKDL